MDPFIMVFRFTTEVALLRAMQRTPILWNKGMVIFAKAEPDDRVAEMVINSCDLTVKLLDFPPSLRTIENFQALGNCFGSFIDAEKGSLEGDKSWVRLRVSLRIDLPILPVLKCLTPKGDEVTIAIEYESVPSICYYCAVIGHIADNCITRFQEDPCGTAALPYEPFFRNTKPYRYTPPPFIGMQCTPSPSQLSDVAMLQHTEGGQTSESHQTSTKTTQTEQTTTAIDKLVGRLKDFVLDGQDNGVPLDELEAQLVQSLATIRGRNMATALPDMETDEPEPPTTKEPAAVIVTTEITEPVHFPNPQHSVPHCDHTHCAGWLPFDDGQATFPQSLPPRHSSARRDFPPGFEHNHYSNAQHWPSATATPTWSHTQYPGESSQQIMGYQYGMPPVHPFVRPFRAPSPPQVQPTPAIRVQPSPNSVLLLNQESRDSTDVSASVIILENPTIPREHINITTDEDTGYGDNVDYDTDRDRLQFEEEEETEPEEIRPVEQSGSELRNTENHEQAGRAGSKKGRVFRMLNSVGTRARRIVASSDSGRNSDVHHRRGKRHFDDTDEIESHPSPSAGLNKKSRTSQVESGTSTCNDRAAIAMQSRQDQ